MPLLKNACFVGDAWVRIEDSAPLPDGGSLILSFTRVKAEWDRISSHPVELGIALTNADEIDDIAVYLPHVALIVLPFPAFTDGRSYSIAHQIRSLGYRGELRATGNVLPDQLQMMLQVGFDSFEVSDRFSLEDWQKTSHQMSLAYQRGLYRPSAEVEVWNVRHPHSAKVDEQEEKPYAG